MITINGWKTTSLPLLLRLIKSGGTPDTSRSDYYGGDIPFVTIEDMTASSRHLSSTIKTLTDEGLKHSNAWVVPANSILYSIYATLGLPRINTVPVATNQAILALINYPNKIDRDYLYYWFEYIRASVVNFSSQTTQSNLNATTVKTFLVDHPTDLSEQTKIAEVLSTVDLAIEQTETLIAKQQRIKTGLMQDLLTRGIDEHGNLRSEQTHEFKDSPLGRIPVEWEVGGFDNYVINDAGIKPGPFGSSLTKDMYVQEGCRVYGQEQVIGGTLDIGDYFIPKRKFTEMAGFAVRVGDVLISLVGTIGHVLIVPNDHHPGLINPRLLRFRPDTRHCLPEFLRVLLLSQPIRLQLDTFATGGTMPVLSAGIIRKLCVVVIKADEQARIIQTISKSEECIFSASESLNKLRSLKTGLMQDLLTGKKRVTALLEASL